MIKALISSKELAEVLNKIDIEKNSILSVHATQKYISINILGWQNRVHLANIIEYDLKSYSQINYRWDWIKDLMNQVDEQPVVLEIMEKKVRVIFEYSA